MTKIISALFETYADAERSVTQLEAADIPNTDISLVTGDVEASNSFERDVVAGAGAGAALGGVGGVLAGLALLTAPGVGQVVAAGWIAAALVGATMVAGATTGAVVGAGAGGAIGSLTEAGFPSSESHLYAEALRRGRSLVAVRVADEREGEVRAILAKFPSLDPSTVRSAYEAEGWAGPA
ncbi:hypothetical protein ACETRX_35735 [Labrys portucalensis]|uniref:DUF1269 domain-containing protein n=1 Tax=Labrys neptuniae TaxID=376174 RepID=A0ABV6ZS05_9HYPH